MANYSTSDAIRRRYYLSDGPAEENSVKSEMNRSCKPSRWSYGLDENSLARKLSRHDAGVDLKVFGAEEKANKRPQQFCSFNGNGEEISLMK